MLPGTDALMARIEIEINAVLDCQNQPFNTGIDGAIRNATLGYFVFVITSPGLVCILHTSTNHKTD